MDADHRLALRNQIETLVRESIAPLVVQVITQRITQYAEVLHDELLPATRPSAAREQWDDTARLDWLLTHVTRLQLGRVPIDARNLTRLDIDNLHRGMLAAAPSQA